MDVEAAEAEDISSRAASRAMAAAIIMDMAVEAAADAAVVAVEAEPSRARTPTTKLNLESSRSTAGRTDATAAIMVSNANSRPWATFRTQPRAIPCRGTPRMRIESIYRAQLASLITGDGRKRSKRGQRKQQQYGGNAMGFGAAGLFDYNSSSRNGGNGYGNGKFGNQ